MSSKQINIAVAGATGAVGNQMIACLEERHFPIKSIKLLASHRSVGRELRFKGDLIPVEEFPEQGPELVWNDSHWPELWLARWRGACPPHLA